MVTISFKCFGCSTSTWLAPCCGTPNARIKVTAFHIDSHRAVWLPSAVVVRQTRQEWSVLLRFQFSISTDKLPYQIVCAPNLSLYDTRDMPCHPRTFKAPKVYPSSHPKIFKNPHSPNPLSTGIVKLSSISHISTNSLALAQMPPHTLIIPNATHPPTAATGSPRA